MNPNEFLCCRGACDKTLFLRYIQAISKLSEAFIPSCNTGSPLGMATMPARHLQLAQTTKLQVRHPLSIQPAVLLRRGAEEPEAGALGVRAQRFRPQSVHGAAQLLGFLHVTQQYVEANPSTRTLVTGSLLLFRRIRKLCAGQVSAPAEHCMLRKTGGAPQSGASPARAYFR